MPELGAELAEVASRLAPEWTPEGVLGHGATSLVVSARGPRGERVAVKVLRAKLLRDDSARERLVREGRAAKIVRHPCIVTVHAVDVARGLIVMEPIEGETLAQRLRREHKLAPAEVRRIGAALLEALAAVHDAGIVHRDVKPANVLLGRDGAVKLADFGVAMVDESERLLTSGWVGSTTYIAPEQLAGAGVDGRADLYSAAATLFEAVTGAPPDRDADVAATVRGRVPDRRLARALARALAPDPARRVRDALTFRAHLVAASPRLKPLHLAGAAVLAFAALGAAAWLVWAR